MNETGLLQAIRALPRDIKPQRDLWPAVEARLNASTPMRKPRSYALHWRLPAMAAATVMALVTGIFVGRGMVAPSTDQLATGQLAPTVLEYALAGTVMATEREYQAAFRELAPLDYSGLGLTGESPDILRGSWEDLLQVETSLLAALSQHPSNIFLQEKLLDLRSQQLRFIKQLALLEQNNWRTT